MERITERTADGIVAKEDHGEDVLKTIYQCYGAEPMPHYANCDEGYCAIEKLAEYEDLEEQGKLLKLPCAVGDTVYAIELDEENFTQFHAHRKISKYEFTLEMVSLLELFGRCIFLTREEAEAALKE